jgi:hypothetical protein
LDVEAAPRACLHDTLVRHVILDDEDRPTGVVQYCLLDVGGEQDQAEDAGRIAGACDPLLGGDLLDVAVAALR